jgi:hypothetical protein
VQPCWRILFRDISCTPGGMPIITFFSDQLSQQRLLSIAPPPSTPLHPIRPSSYTLSIRTINRPLLPKKSTKLPTTDSTLQPIHHFTCRPYKNDCVKQVLATQISQHLSTGHISSSVQGLGKSYCWQSTCSTSSFYTRLTSQPGR